MWRFVFAFLSSVLSRSCLVLVVLTAALPLNPSDARAEAVRDVKRHVLALYDSAREATPTATRVHKLAEMPLNHLGYIVVYRDIRQPLPASEELERFRAVLTWFDQPLDDPARYFKWAQNAAANGLRFIILGETGGEPWTEAGNRRVNRLMHYIGLRHMGEGVEVTVGSSVAHIDRSFIGFERALDPAPPPFPVLQSADPGTKALLELVAPPLDGRKRSVVAAVSPGGGFCANGYLIYFDEESERIKWVLNPFAFFSAALGDERFPIPDTTTISGRRVYFSHVDGDALNNIAQFPPYNDPPTTAAQVMLKELIEPYPDLPVTFGLVAGDIDPAIGGSAKTAEVVRAIFAQPQVEVGSHTYTHPFKWQFFENYDREAEIAQLEQAWADRKPDLSVAERIERLTGEEVEPIEKYTAHILGLPRAYMKEPFDLMQEVDKAREATEALAPPGKKLALYQWSGNTMAFEAAIERTRQLGLPNINGGDTRFDLYFDSIAYVPPISRVAGGQRQIYAVNSNENTYSNNWEGPFYGQRALVQTLENTELPRRLKGFNLYYHTYSAEKKASLNAVKSILDLARSSPVIPIEASRYARIADSFFEVRIAATGSLSWDISNRGDLQTVRFDHSDGLSVDLAASRGVIGSNRHGRALYVSLDQDVEKATVALFAPAAGETQPPNRVSLKESRWLVSGLKRISPSTFSFTTGGYGKGAFVWQGLPAGPCQIAASQNGAQILVTTVESNAEETLEFELPMLGRHATTLTVSCSPR